MPRVDQPSLLPKEKRRKEVPVPASVDLEMQAYANGCWQRWIRWEIENGTWGINYGDRNKEAQALAERMQKERGGG